MPRQVIQDPVDISVDDASELTTQIDDLRVIDGTRVWNRAPGTDHGLWCLDQTNVQPVGPGVVPTGSGTGRWIYFGAGGGAGGLSNVFLWDASTTWDVVYAAIVAAGGFGIVLVKADGPKEMTPLPGGGDTDLSNLLFIGLLPKGGKPPHLNVDSLGVGGFSLGGNHNITSKDIDWITYYRIGGGSQALWQFDGGGMTSATANDAYNSPFFNLVLKNRALVDGSNCAQGLITGVTQGASVYMTTSSALGSQVIFGLKGLPPYPTWGVERDSSCTIDPLSFLNPAGGGTLIDALSDKSQFVDPSRGPTLARPTGFPGLLVGQQYFDTDLGYPIWWDGAQWVDASGTPV